MQAAIFSIVVLTLMASSGPIAAASTLVDASALTKAPHAATDARGKATTSSRGTDTFRVAGPPADPVDCCKK